MLNILMNFYHLVERDIFLGKNLITDKFTELFKHILVYYY